MRRSTKYFIHHRPQSLTIDHVYEFIGGQPDAKVWEGVRVAASRDILRARTEITREIMPHVYP